MLVNALRKTFTHPASEIVSKMQLAEHQQGFFAHKVQKHSANFSMQAEWGDDEIYAL